MGRVNPASDTNASRARAGLNPPDPPPTPSLNGRFSSPC
jgi:hypothetical protein